MTIKRIIFIFSIIVFSMLFIILASVSSLFLFIPRYVESEVIPLIAKDKGLEITSLKIRSIGLTGAEISDVKIGPENSERFEIDTVRIDYSISGLLERQLERVVLSGVSVNARYENSSLSIEGLDNLLNNNKGQNNSASTPPVEIKTLLITNSVINLRINGNTCMIPFDLTAAAFDQNYLPGRIRMMVSPDGNRISIEGNREGNDKIKLAVKASEFSLSLFEDIINGIAPVDIKGRAGIDLTTTLSLNPFSITDVSFSCRLDKTVTRYAGLLLKNPSDPGTGEQPVEIKIKSMDASHWDYEVSPILLVYDTLTLKSNLSGNAAVSGGTLQGEINAITRLLTVEDEPTIQWDISVNRINSAEPAKIQITGKGDSEIKSAGFNAFYKGLDITAISPQVNALLDYDKGALSGSYTLKLKNIRAEIDEMSFSLPMVSIKGSIKNEMTEYVSSFSMSSKEIVYKDREITAKIPNYTINGIAGYDKENGLNSDVRITFKKGIMSMNDRSVKVSGISGEIPVAWPFYKKKNKGQLHIEGMTYGKHAFGPIDIEIPQKGSDITFAGTVKYPSLPDMPLNLSGSISLDPDVTKADVNFDVPGYQPSSDIKLGRVFPELKGYSFNGLVKSHGNITLSKTLLTSGLELEIEHGKIGSSEKRLTLEDISLNVILEDLISLRSLSGQKLKIGKISFGDIEATDFMVDFRIENLTSLFIEQGRFKWCGGNINVQSFRVDTKKDEYMLTLFCDRISLADILKQFGVAGVSGGGSVNGKIPLTISKGKIVFEDGFLYSTPGNGGKINITGTDIFKQGMTPGSPEYIQMDIASEALKAFDYSWVKMALNSDKDDLNVTLQFDGKPENKLPFRYDKDINRFMRVETTAEGSNFQGISLDVNFKLPLDELLNYKSALDMINF